MIWAKSTRVSGKFAPDRPGLEVDRGRACGGGAGTRHPTMRPCAALVLRSRRVLERTHVGAAGAFGRPIGADRASTRPAASRGSPPTARTAARLGRAARASDEPHGRARGGRLAVRALPRAPPRRDRRPDPAGRARAAHDRRDQPRHRRHDHDRAHELQHHGTARARQLLQLPLVRRHRRRRARRRGARRRRGRVPQRATVTADAIRHGGALRGNGRGARARAGSRARCRGPRAAARRERDADYPLHVELSGHAEGATCIELTPQAAGGSAYRGSRTSRCPTRRSAHQARRLRDRRPPATSSTGSSASSRCARWSTSSTARPRARSRASAALDGTSGAA